MKEGKTTEKYEPRQCPRCGEMFPCREDSDCWCLKIKLPDTVSDYIADRYEGCLCSQCLEELKDKSWS